MLILTRKPGEIICIGNTIEVTILEIRGSQIRVGITAPSDISVDRKEVRIRKEHEGNKERSGLEDRNI